eukprot:304834-Rhodomonas_salina.3
MSGTGCVSAYAVPGTGWYQPMRCPVLGGISLRVVRYCPAHSAGCTRAYRHRDGATRFHWWVIAENNGFNFTAMRTGASCLRARYAMSGTPLAYGARYFSRSVPCPVLT